MKTQKSPTTHKPRVCVGLSGGVDSSVTAALLKQQGYDVIGVYMKNWSDESLAMGARPLDPEAYRMDCPWYDDYLDAKRVALQLDIPFEMWDFREAYKKKVFDYFIEEFDKGRTPNPDIYCNSLVKFDDFQKRALDERQVDYVATGHYADMVRVDGYTYLKIPQDKHKDQTYFLYRLNQKQLQTALFPLADYPKDQVRKLAQQFELPTQYKKDSQGICFIGEVDVRDFISQWLVPKEGRIVDPEGRELGTHKGVHLYTYGEKVAVDNGLVAQIYPELKHDIPVFYVAQKDIEANRLVVVPGTDNPALYHKNVALELIHWTASEADRSQVAYARLRHGGALVAVSQLMTEGETGRLTFAESQRATAPGQHIVFYSNDDRVLGGGVIAALS